jgi:hypothetical protein
MGKKSKYNHRRETLREAELQRERELDEEREARRMKREANLLQKGVPLPEQAPSSWAMDVETPTEAVALQPTLRKKGTQKRTANFAKTNINKVGVRKALPRISVSGIAKSKRRRPGKLMKKQLKRMAKAGAMEL